MTSEQTILYHLQKRLHLKRFELSFQVQVCLTGVAEDDSKIIGVGETITEAALDLFYKQDQTKKPVTNTVTK